MKATNGGRLPAVVRGLFNGTKALRLWPTRDYLPRIFEGIDIPVVKDGRVGTLQDDREVQAFGDAFRELYDADYAKKYMFFPVKSRVMFNGSKAGSTDVLQEVCSKVAIEDLELERIFPGFGTKAHKTFVGSQFVIGKSNVDFLIGSNWHCAVGNNYFVQVTFCIFTTSSDFDELFHYNEGRWKEKMGIYRTPLFSLSMAVKRCICI